MVDFRKAFAEKLNEFVIPSTTPQEDKSSMIKELDDLVLHNLPSSLYKYRSCNIRNIEALSRNVTYGVPVSYMNDPMDGLVYIDKNKIIADAKFGLSRGFVEFVKSTKCLPSSMDIYFFDMLPICWYRKIFTLLVVCLPRIVLAPQREIVVFIAYEEW